MSFIRAHKIEIGIFALALIVRCLYFGIALNAHNGDLIATSQAADGYFTISQNLLAGHGFSSEVAAPFVPNSFRVPLQPYFLAVTAGLAGSYYLPLILTLLMSCLFPLIAMRFARRISSSKSVILGTGIFLALEPFSVLFAVLFYSETLFMLFLFASLLCLFKYFESKKFLHLIFSSAFIGFATLTRPTTEYLALVLAAILIWESRAHLTKQLWLRVGAYILTFFVVIAPWLYRNEMQFGILALTPQTGVNLYAILLPSVLSVEKGTSFETEYQAIQAQGISGPNQTNVVEAQNYASQAIPILLKHPVALVLTAGTVEFSFFTHDGMLDFLRLLGIKPDLSLGTPALFLLIHDPVKLLWFIGHYLSSPFALILLMRIIWVIVTIGFFVGAVRYIKKEGLTPYAATMLVTIFYISFTTILIGLSINARYRLPVEALIVPFAFYGFSYLYRLIWNRSQ